MHLFQQLDNEWNQIVAGCEGRRACLRWNRADPVLVHIKCPDQLVQEIRCSAAVVQSDQLLSAIVALAPHDQMAARVVLQALVPGLRTIARKLRTLADADEVEAAVVAAAWTRIRTYPHARRPRHVAANIVLDTRKDAIRQLRGNQEHAFLEEESLHVVHTDVDLLSVLREAESLGLITPADTELITATRVTGETLTRVARRSGVSSEAARKRRSRAEARLRLVPSAR